MSSCQKDRGQIARTQVCFDDGWEANQKVVLAYPCTNDSISVDISITHDQGYGYENLYIKINRNRHASNTDEIRSIQLLSPEGYWIGEASGGAYTHEEKLLLPSVCEVDTGDSMIVSVTHYARVDTLLGVRCIALVATTDM